MSEMIFIFHHFFSSPFAWSFVFKISTWIIRSLWEDVKNSKNSIMHSHRTLTHAVLCYFLKNYFCFVDEVMPEWDSSIYLRTETVKLVRSPDTARFISDFTVSNFFQNRVFLYFCIFSECLLHIHLEIRQCLEVVVESGKSSTVATGENW